MMDTDTRLERHLRRWGFDGNTVIRTEENNVIISLMWGHWKKHHIRLINLMEQAGYRKVQDRVTMDEGSDVYSADYLFEPVPALTYQAAGAYGEEIAKLIRQVRKRDRKATAEAASLLAPLIPDYSVMLPVPSHDGSAGCMLEVCGKIEELKPTVAVAGKITCRPHASICEYRKENEEACLPFPEELMMYKNGIINYKNVCIVDDVIASGTTALAAYHASGNTNAALVTLADDVRYLKIKGIKH